MSGYFVLTGILVALMVAYQIHISRRVSRSPYYSGQQRWLQLIMVWTLPIVGAALCQTMLSDSEAAEITTGDADDHVGDDHSTGDD